jgi:hypothetical protein
MPIDFNDFKKFFKKNSKPENDLNQNKKEFDFDSQASKTQQSKNQPEEEFYEAKPGLENYSRFWIYINDLNYFFQWLTELMVEWYYHINPSPADPGLTPKEAEVMKKQRSLAINRREFQKDLRERERQITSRLAQFVAKLDVKKTICSNWFDEASMHAQQIVETRKHRNFNIEKKWQAQPGWDVEMPNLKLYLDNLCTNLDCIKEEIIQQQQILEISKSKDQLSTHQSNNNLNNLRLQHLETLIEDFKAKLENKQNDLEACEGYLKEAYFNINKLHQEYPSNCHHDTGRLPGRLQLPSPQSNLNNEYEFEAKPTSSKKQNLDKNIVKYFLDSFQRDMNSFFFSKIIFPIFYNIVRLVVISILIGISCYALAFIYMHLEIAIRQIPQHVAQFKKRRRRHQTALNYYDDVQQWKSKERERQKIEQAILETQRQAELELEEKKESRQFWQKYLGSLKNIVKFNRGGHAIPLQEVNIFTLNQFEQKMILASVDPITQVIKLEKTRVQLNSQLQLLEKYITVRVKLEGVLQIPNTIKTQVWNPEIKTLLGSIVLGFSVLCSGATPPISRSRKSPNVELIRMRSNHLPTNHLPTDISLHDREDSIVRNGDVDSPIQLQNKNTQNQPQNFKNKNKNIQSRKKEKKRIPLSQRTMTLDQLPKPKETTFYLVKPIFKNGKLIGIEKDGVVINEDLDVIQTFDLE